MWDDYEWNSYERQEADQDFDINFDFFSALVNPKDYYKILEVDYDATDEAIRSNYIQLALGDFKRRMVFHVEWHPDKKKDDEYSTSRFQEINEAYQVLSDPVKRREYDEKGLLYVYDYNILEYLNRHRGLILTCNGLGLKHSIW